MKIKNLLGITISVTILFTSVISGFVSYGSENIKFDDVPEQIRNLYDFSKVECLSDLGEEDLSSLTLKNTDGTYTLLQFDEPIRFYDDVSGTYKFIDNTIVNSSNINYEYENSANTFSCKFSNSFSDGILFEDDKYSVKFTPVSSYTSSSKPVSKIDDENAVVYEDAFGEGIDLKYAFANNGLKENIVIEEYKDFTSYSFVVDLEGLQINDNENSYINLLDEITGEEVLTFAPTFIVDSTGENISYDNCYTIEKISSDKYNITVKLDESFLKDETTQYPCVVDPILFYTGTNSFSGCYATQSGSTVLNNYYQFGSFNGTGECISYIKVLGLNKKRWLNPNNIIEADLKLRDCSSGNYNSGTITCYDSNSILNVNNVTYSQLVSSIISTPKDTVSVSAANIEYSFNITDLMKAWIRDQIGQGGFSYDYGFILRGNSSLVNRKAYKIDPNDIYNAYIAIDFEYDLPIEDGIYKISSYYNQNYMQNNGVSQNVTAPSGTLSNNGKWLISKSQSGRYTIQPYNNSSLYLRYNSSSANTNVIVSTTSSEWYIVQNSNNTYRILPGSQNSANAVTYSSGTIMLNDYLNADSQKWNISPLYTATINDYYDMGYPVYYGETASVSESYLNGYIDAISSRYMQLFGLKITRNNATYYNSPIDICKGTVTASNIDSLCTHTAPIHTERNNVISAFNSNYTGSITITNILWSAHRITSTATNGTTDYNRSCSSGTSIIMIERSDATVREINSKGVAMHELNHQYGARDHYHELADLNDPGSCKFKEICSCCGDNPRPSTCIMYQSRIDISNSNVICSECKSDILSHLDGHHGN